MALPLDFVERVRESNDIVEVVREYFPLKKAGQNYKALCPFHSEKTPSFFVSPSKQIFHCFGCGEGGDVIGFVMKIENISFYEAVKKLAERAGIPVPHFKEEPEEAKRKKILLGILKRTAEFYSRYFWESKKAEEARKYMLEERGVKEEVLKEFMIGYAPRGSVLVEEARKSGIDITLLEESGVVVYRVDKKKYEDRFSNRIIFPIKDSQGRVVGFGGRILGKGEPKYLNSPETRYFHKSRILYNFDKVKEYALKENSIIITEGYMDVIGLWQVGIKNVVATMGTAFTSQHVRLISRFVERVYLLFDPDFAGKEAVLRSTDLLLKSGLDVRVVINETEMEPDEIAKEKGFSFLKDMIKNGMDLIGFRIKEAVKGRDI
ncbi:MAG: DNA primase, partial [Caldiserica bacterium]